MIKVIFILSLILLAGAGYYFFVRDRGVSPVQQEVGNEPATEEAVAPSREYMSEADRKRILFGDVTINIPDIGVQTVISEGKGTFDAGEGFQGFVMLGDKHASAVVDDREFILAHASLNTGGMGIFDYIFAFRVDEGSLTHTSSAHIGDLIVVRSVSARKGGTQERAARTEVIVDILERGENEPLVVDPTIEKRFVFTLNRDGILNLRTSF
jgi:hypothetical protein